MGEFQTKFNMFLVLFFESYHFLGCAFVAEWALWYSKRDIDHKRLYLAAESTVQNFVLPVLAF